MYVFESFYFYWITHIYLRVWGMHTETRRKLLGVHFLLLPCGCQNQTLVISIKLSGRRLYLLSTDVLLMWWITIYSLNFICIYVVSPAVPNYPSLSLSFSFFWDSVSRSSSDYPEMDLVRSRTVKFWTKDFVSWAEGNEVLQNLKLIILLLFETLSHCPNTCT